MDELIKAGVNFVRGIESSILRLALFLATLGILLVLVIALESAMGLVTIGRLERKVNLLNELSESTESGMGSKDQLAHLFDEAVSDLDDYDPNIGQIVSRILQIHHQPSFLELIAGAGTWILLGMLTLKTTKGGVVMKVLGFALFTVFGLVIGIFTDLLVATEEPIVALILNFLCGGIPFFIFLAVLVRHSQKQTQSANSETSHNSQS